MQLLLLHCMHTEGIIDRIPMRCLQLSSCRAFQAQCSIRAPFSLYLMPGLFTRCPCSSKKRPPFRICGTPSATPDTADHGDKKLMLLSLPCKKSIPLTGGYQLQCSRGHNMNALEPNDRRPVVCRVCRAEDCPASVALQVGIAGPAQDKMKHLNGLDLRYEGSSHSLWLLSKGIEEAPGHWRGALQQQICQHHSRRQVVAADAHDACGEAQLLTPPLDCSGSCQPLDAQHHLAADESAQLCRRGCRWQSTLNTPAHKGRLSNAIQLVAKQQLLWVPP